MKLTIAIIAINVAVFIASLMNFDFFIQNFGFSVNGFLSGKVYTVITSMFVHGGFSHLFFNMLALAFLGYSAEQCIRRWQFLVVYFVSGIIGNLLLFGVIQIPFFGYTANTIAIGASAAIAGIVGLGAFICPTKLVFFEFIPLPFIAAGALFLVMNVLGLFLPSDIAYPAHIGGMFVGAAFGLKWGKKRARNIFLFILATIVIVLVAYLASVFL